MKQDGYLKVLSGWTTVEEVLRVAQDRWAVGVFRTLEWTEVASFATEPEAKAFLRGVLSAETTLRDIRSALREAA